MRTINFNVNGRVPSKQNIMAVRIRLARRGRKKLAIFDIVVADARSPRDGKIIQKIGNYNPNTNPATKQSHSRLYWSSIAFQSDFVFPKYNIISPYP